MILIPRRNKYSKDRPSWQQKVNRRLKLLKYAGFPFFGPGDWELVGPIPPEIQKTSTGVFPYGTVSAAAGGDQGTLGLTALNSNNSDDVAASSGCRFLTDGDIQEIISGAWTDQNPSTEWIDAFGGGESSSDYEAKYDRTSGDAESHTGFTGENTYTTISATLTWQLTQIGTGSKSSSGTAYCREIATPANVVSASYSLFVSVSGDGCPLCCFTPDTMVTLGDGTARPISEVEAGEIIRVMNGLEEVTGVVTREDRAMYRVRFSDDRYLDVSDDHPLYVEGKGFAAINPVVPYKDLGMAQKLAIGDWVTTLANDTVRVVSIERIDYPDKVYTFENSKFFANGLLVY